MIGAIGEICSPKAKGFPWLAKKSDNQPKRARPPYRPAESRVSTSGEAEARESTSRLFDKSYWAEGRKYEVSRCRGVRDSERYQNFAFQTRFNNLRFRALEDELSSVTNISQRSGLAKLWQCDQKRRSFSSPAGDASQLPTCCDMPQTLEVPSDDLREVFMRFDRDCDGYLDRREITTMLEELWGFHIGTASADPMSHRRLAFVDRVIRENDQDDDGRINFEEFARLYDRLETFFGYLKESNLSESFRRISSKDKPDVVSADSVGA